LDEMIDVFRKIFHDVFGTLKKGRDTNPLRDGEAVCERMGWEVVEVVGRIKGVVDANRMFFPSSFSYSSSSLSSHFYSHSNLSNPRTRPIRMEANVGPDRRRDARTASTSFRQNPRRILRILRRRSCDEEPREIAF